MAATDAANVNELQAPELRGVRRRGGVVDLPLTYLDAAEAREPSRGAKYLISDAQHPRPPQMQPPGLSASFRPSPLQPPRVHVLSLYVRTLACSWTGLLLVTGEVGPALRLRVRLCLYAAPGLTLAAAPTPTPLVSRLRRLWAQALRPL